MFNSYLNPKHGTICQKVFKQDMIQTDIRKEKGNGGEGEICTRVILSGNFYVTL